MAAAGLRAIRHFPVRRLRIRAKGWDEPCRSPCVFVGNNEYGLTGLWLGRRERMDEGQLCLVVAKQQSASALLGLVFRSMFGFLNQERDLRILKTKELEVSSHHRKLLIALDGEVETIRAPLTYRTRPGALRVFSPPATDHKLQISDA
jgi:diacylglycerol kinase family enzyme